MYELDAANFDPLREQLDPLREQTLMSPGPTQVPPDVLEVLARPVLHHRAPRFRAALRGVRSGLQELAETENPVLLLACTGTGAMESAVVNVCGPGDAVLVVSAGYFGERWVEIMKAWGMKATVLTAPYGDVVAPAAVEQALAQNGNFKGVFVQASETSTGVQHDVKAMGLAVKKTNAIFVVDAITGIGTMPLDIDGCVQVGMALEATDHTTKGLLIGAIRPVGVMADLAFL